MFRHFRFLSKTNFRSQTAELNILIIDKETNDPRRVEVSGQHPIVSDVLFHLQVSILTIIFTETV